MMPRRNKQTLASAVRCTRLTLLQCHMLPTLTLQEMVTCAGNATGAYDVNTKLKITGLGIKVGVIDTGKELVKTNLHHCSARPRNLCTASATPVCCSSALHMSQPPRVGRLTAILLSGP